MTKVNLDTLIRDLSGDPISDLTAKKIMVDALLVTLEEDARLTGEQKIKNFTLAQRVSCGGEVELIAEDIALIKSRVARAFNTLVTGRVWELLDPASVAV